MRVGGTIATLFENSNRAALDHRGELVSDETSCRTPTRTREPEVLFIDILLKGGPLDGETVTFSASRRTYSTQIENRHVAYDESNERTERGQPVFTYRQPLSSVATRKTHR
jgi:hypothetical protein